MTHHLLLISIGPVQSFISQARKLRDLRSGSRLLSQINGQMCVDFIEAGGSVIVPGNAPRNASELRDVGGLPNRMLGTIAGKSEKQIVQLARDLEHAALAYWKSEARKVLQTLPTSDEQSKSWRARFEEQIDQLLECYWAIEPYTGLDAYQEAYEYIEARLGAVKNSRVFDQVGSAFGGDESSRKDALTGERDALVFGYKKGAKAKEFPATTDVDLPRRLVDRGPPRRTKRRPQRRKRRQAFTTIRTWERILFYG